MTEKKLYKALSCIMNDLVVQKSNIDTGTAGKYKAFTIDTVLENTKTLLPKYEVMTFVNNELHETQYITKTGKYGDKTTHNVIVKTIVEFCHTETGETHSSIAYGEASDAGDKALSKAQTDGFKKALCQTFHLFDDDGDKDRTPNDDNEKIVKTIQKPVEKKQEPQKQSENSNRKITTQERDELQQLIYDAGKDIEKLCLYYKVEALNQLTYIQYRSAKASCEKAINEMN